MKFLIDAMFPPATCAQLNARGHDAVSPGDLGAHSLPDETLIQLASSDDRVIVTENAGDLAHVTTCTVLFVRKSWWPRKALASSLTEAIDRWAAANPKPGTWSHWLEAEFR